MLPQVQRQPWMSEEIDSFRQEIRRVIAAEFSPRLDAWRRQGFIPREAWQQLGDLGALLPEIDEIYGGSGSSVGYQMVLQDELARAEIPGLSAVHSIAAHYLLDYGTETQKRRWLLRLARGELFAGIAMTEPGCGSDLKAIRTTARREGDQYVINGTKIFISNAFSGNLLILVVRTGESGSRGVSLVVLETENLPGFAVGRRLEKIGQHAADTSEVFLENVRVPVGNLLGCEEGRGFAQLMSQLPFERMLIAVCAAAAIERAVEVTVEYVKERKAFAKTLSEFQNTRFKLAECATIAHVVRTFVNDCIQRLVDGTLDTEAAYMAKWWSAEQQCRVTDECLQLFGGYGYMQDYVIGRLFVDSRAQKIYGGTNEIMKDLIARKLFE